MSRGLSARDEGRPREAGERFSNSNGCGYGTVTRHAVQRTDGGGEKKISPRRLAFALKSSASFFIAAVAAAYRTEHKGPPFSRPKGLFRRRRSNQ